MVPVVTVESCTSIFQVREARTLCLFGVKTVAGTDKLAQASWSRLGETNRGSPKPFFHEWSPRRPTVILSERASRPGERGLA
ncbi:hypothetical protein DEO72_LG3g72 [Vigna unguiculata]|uniref:Uncharacterized protein n=1 Tax=Vigna unguiculata TaxID=3917 RepID=A0A4D6LAJ1_VIGUN|nr:hypothetical protein DEO72_LG3g72 [Vigna unguiculata]